MNKDEVRSYLEEHSMDIQNAHVCFLGLSWAYEAYTLSHQVTGINISPLFGYFDDKGYTQISDDTKLISIGDWLYSNYQKNPEIISELLKKQSYHFAKIERSFEQLNKSTSNQELLKIFDDVVADSIEWWKYPVIGETKGTMIEKHIVPRFAADHNLSIPESHDYLYTLAYSGELANFTQEILLRHKLALKAFADPALLDSILKNQDCSNNELLSELFQQYLKEFYWINTDFYEAKPVELSDFVNKLRSLTSMHTQEIEAEIEQIELEAQKTLERKLQLEKNLGLTTQDTRDIDFISEFIKLMEQRKIQMMKQCFVAYSVCREMSSRMGVEYDDIAFISYQELRDSFQNKTGLDQKKIDAMKAGAFAVYADGIIQQIFTGEDAQELLSAAKKPSDSLEVKGMVASRGNVENVEGNVRIVHRPDEQFNKGDILVTSMTRVELVPIMKLASAIITDEGGMACHAAIVSRELGIPCIVGTKNATQIFGDGDKIIVDLNRGIAEKLL